MDVRVDRDGPVTVVTIDRPATRNAIDGPTARALARAFWAFDDDDEQSVAVLTGAGGTFCSGADLKALTGEGERPVLSPPETGAEGPLGVTRMLLGKPVIAAVEGHAVAGGLELAVWCDLRVAATDAVFGVFCRRWGVPLVDGGTLRLPRLIGQSRAMDMILTGRGVAGEEAERFGLVNRLVPPGEALPHAVALAHELAAFPQQCLRADRRSVRRQWGLEWDEAMALEYRGGIAVLESGEALEGALRFSEGEGRHGAF